MKGLTSPVLLLSLLFSLEACSGSAVRTRISAWTLKPGKALEFEGLTLWISARDGVDVRGVKIVGHSPPGVPKPVTTARAGRLDYSERSGELELVLEDAVTVIHYARQGRIDWSFGSHVPIVLRERSRRALAIPG